MKYLFVLIVLMFSVTAQAQTLIHGTHGEEMQPRINHCFTFGNDGIVRDCQYPYQPPYNLPIVKSEPAERLFNKGQVAATLLYTLGATLDATSSVGGRELNPAFRNAQGKYNLPLNLVAKGAVYGIALAIEAKWPKSRHFIRIVLGSSGLALVGVAAHNYAVR